MKNIFMRHPFPLRPNSSWKEMVTKTKEEEKNQACSLLGALENIFLCPASPGIVVLDT